MSSPKVGGRVVTLETGTRLRLGTRGCGDGRSGEYLPDDHEAVAYPVGTVVRIVRDREEESSGIEIGRVGKLGIVSGIKRTKTRGVRYTVVKIGGRRQHAMFSAEDLEPGDAHRWEEDRIFYRALEELGS